MIVSRNVIECRRRPPRKKVERLSPHGDAAAAQPKNGAAPAPPAPAQPRKLLDAKPRKRKKTDKKPK